ncbi:MAG TPA: hypothetical protein VHB45_12520 [Alloacidobacterium sp.]|nr:hypothetical protein [Alloacidobacterium sp.]
MSSSPISSAVTYIEPVLWAVSFIAFLRSGSRKTLSAFGAFLGMGTVGVTLLHLFARNDFFGNSWLQSSASLYTYRAFYFVGSVLLFFALQQMFRQVTASFPALSRFGNIIFYCIGSVALVVSAVSVFAFIAASPARVPSNVIFTEINCDLCISLLCLLAFVIVFIRAAKYPMASRIFGICLGLGLIAVAQLTAAMFQAMHFDRLSNRLSFSALAVALVIWTGFFFYPEPAARKGTSPATVRTLHWNDLAQELGPTEQAQPAAQQSGFLQSVEGVVDRVLAKNSVGGAG